MIFFMGVGGTLQEGFARARPGGGNSLAGPPAPTTLRQFSFHASSPASPALPGLAHAAAGQSFLGTELSLDQGDRGRARAPPAGKQLMVHRGFGAGAALLPGRADPLGVLLAGASHAHPPRVETGPGARVVFSRGDDFPE